MGNGGMAVWCGMLERDMMRCWGGKEGSKRTEWNDDATGTRRKLCILQWNQENFHSKDGYKI